MCDKEFTTKDKDTDMCDPCSLLLTSVFTKIIRDELRGEFKKLSKEIDNN